MTNDVIIKNTAASSSTTESGYVYISLVTWFALLFFVVLNTEIGMLASVLDEDVVRHDVVVVVVQLV